MSEATLRAEWEDFRATAVADGLSDENVRLVRTVFMSGAAAAMAVAAQRGLPAVVGELTVELLQRHGQGPAQGESHETCSPTPGPAL